MFLIIIYKHPKRFKLATNVATGEVLVFTRRNHAVKYAKLNMLGVFQVVDFKGGVI